MTLVVKSIKPLLIASAISAALFSQLSLAATASGESVYEEQEWGLAAIFRSADVIYDNPTDEESVNTFIPMMFYKGEYAYLNGLEGGVYLYNPDDNPWEISLFSRIRFIDIPAEYQNSIEGDTSDLGLRFKYQANDEWYTSVEAMSDRDGMWYGSLHARGEYNLGDFNLVPHATLRYKSADFNSRYYGLDGWTDDETGQNLGTGIGSGTDLKIGFNATYHVVSNLYLHGGLSALILDGEATSPSFIDQSVQGEYYLGLGFYNNKDEPRKKELDSKAYWRVAHGWGTPTNIGNIIKFKTEPDPYNSQLTSVFYGHPLTDELFGVPLDIYLTPGFVWHWSHEMQDNSQEYVLGIKAYYTIPWPVEWRIGIAEGLSYANEIIYLERSEFEDKGYDNPSHLLNYLDFSFDVNIGDLFNTRDLDDVWLGYSIHHRSAIFEMSSQYGRLKGGSNYNTVYLQFDF